MKVVQLVTLGDLRLDPPVLTRPKPLALLAYVTLEGSASRDHLRRLFWPGEVRAAANLRVALSQLRTALGNAVDLRGEQMRVTLPCDAVRFRHLLQAGAFDEAVKLYQGAFLSGLKGPMPVELEEWLLTTREELGASAAQAHLDLAEQAWRRRDRPGTRRHAESALRCPGAPPMAPEHLQRLHPLLAATRSALAAQVHGELQDCGEAPGPQLVPEVDAPLHLPTPLTSFVGREEAVGQAVQALTADGVRLATVVGAGGMGKTRLALEVGRHLAAGAYFPDGMWFVALEGARTGEDARQVLASALDVRPAGPLTLAHLAERLRDTRALLILDTLEHLTTLPSDLADLLMAAPHVAVLATSRAPLGLPGEWLLRLDGLALASQAGPSEAERLFLDRGRHAAPHLNLGREDAPLTAQLCQLLHGSPLGIELAAALLRALPLAELVQAVSRDLDALQVAAPAVAERHQGLRAVFESAWVALNAEEQSALAALSVFEGGASATAARVVAGLRTGLLVRLVDRSLVRLSAGGRYDVHGTLLPFVREHFAEQGTQPAVQAAHGRYILEVMATCTRQWRETGDRAARAALEVELPNIRVAWAWACRHKPISAFQGAVDFVTFFDTSGRFAEGAELYEAAATAFLGRGEADSAAWGNLAVNAAWLHYRLGHTAQAWRWADKARRAAQRHEDRADDAAAREAALGVRLRALNTLGSVAGAQGDHAAAIRSGEEALALARQLGDVAREATYQVNLGNARSALGEGEAAEADYERALQLTVPAFPVQATLAYLNYGHLLIFRREPMQPGQAAELLTRGRQMAERTGQVGLLGYFDLYLSRVALAQGQAEQATALAQAARQEADRTGRQELQVAADLMVARVLLDQAAVAQAQAQLSGVWRRAAALPGKAHMLEGLLLQGLLDSRTGSLSRAQAFLRTVLENDTALPGQRREAQLAMMGCPEGPVEAYAQVLAQIP